MPSNVYAIHDVRDIGKEQMEHRVRAGLRDGWNGDQTLLDSFRCWLQRNFSELSSMLA